MRFLFVAMLLASKTLPAADNPMWYFGAPCSTKTDVEEIGDGDWAQCVLREREALRLRWRTWIPEGE